VRKSSGSPREAENIFADFRADTRPAGKAKQIQMVDNAFAETNLDPWLKWFGTTDLILMGINATACVEATARGAVKKGYAIHTAHDLIANPPAWITQNEVRYFEKKGNVYPYTLDLLAALSPPKA